MSKQDNVHIEHRKRLRAKVEKSGINSLAEHEVLEYLLTYAIPRKDTNPTAHNLITKFGNFSNVLDADINDLKKVKGIGENSALFIQSLSQVIDYYKENKRNSKVYKLDSTFRCVQYFRANFEIENKEKFYVCCLTKSYNVFKVLTFVGEDALKVSCDAREIAQTISRSDTNYIFIAHTHPNGKVLPSEEDLIATKRIKELCNTIGIKIIDHIIFNDVDYFSFRSNQMILE